MSRGLEASRLGLFAREDALDAVRERQAHVLVALFALIGAGMAYTAGRNVARAPPSADLGIDLATQLLTPFVFLVPLVALGFVAPALVERRATGALTVLLGLLFSRRTVVLGTLLGRSAVIGGAVLLAVLVALPIGVAMDVPVDPLEFVAAALALVVLAVTFTAVAVCISVVTRSSTRATFAAFAAYAIFVFQLWGYLPLIALYVRHGFSLPEATPEWVAFVAALNPMVAFTNGLAGVSPSLAGATLGSPPSDPAFYERPAFGAVVLAAWIVGSIAFGLRRFESTDL